MRQPNLRNQSKQRGVTLLELLVVLVILAVGSGLMAPSIGSSLQNLRFRSIVRQLMATMRKARSTAVATKVAYEVFFDLEEGRYGFRPLAQANDSFDGDPRQEAAHIERGANPALASIPQPTQQRQPARRGTGDAEGANQQPSEAFAPGAQRTIGVLPQEVKPLPKGLKLTSSDDRTLSTLTFYPKGSSSGGSIKIESSRGHTLFLSIDALTGRVRVSRTAEEES